MLLLHLLLTGVLRSELKRGAWLALSDGWTCGSLCIEAESMCSLDRTFQLRLPHNFRTLELMQWLLRRGLRSNQSLAALPSAAGGDTLDLVTFCRTLLADAVEAPEDVRLPWRCEWLVAVKAHVLSRPSFHALVHDTECRVLVKRYLTRCLVAS
jgi:hypothetical protein